MTLQEVTRTVIKLVEDASGCPVVVNEDRSLTTLAASRIARVFPELFRGDSGYTPSSTVWESAII